MTTPVSRPRCRSLFIAAMLACGLLAASVAAAQSPVRVPGTRVSVVAPAGFEPATLFPGFRQIDTGSSIVITEMAAPFDAVRAGMTPDAMATRGMKLISSEQVRIAGRAGVLMAVSQQANGVPFRSWLGLFGSDAGTVLVVAAFPEPLATELGERMRTAVMSAEWSENRDVDLFDGLPFRLPEPATLKIASRMTNMLLLTTGGKPGPVSPQEPLLVLGMSLNEGEFGDIATFAMNRLRQTARVTNIRDATGRPVTVAGASGYEITATADDTSSGTPLLLYQVIAMRDRAYFIAQGMVGAPFADQYLTQFREVVSSLSFTE